MRRQPSEADPRLEQALRRLKEATDDMRRASASQTGDPKQGEADSRRAADRLREAQELMRGMRREAASQQLDDLARKAEALAERQRDFSGRLQRLFGEQGGQSGTNPPERAPLTPEQFQAGQQLAAEKQGMSAALEQIERDMKNAARQLAGSQPSASSKLREALGNMQKEELALRMRFNAEMLRKGLGAHVWMREAPITKGLEDLRDGLREALAALDRNPPGQNKTERALAQVERLRSRMEQLASDTEPRPPGSGGQRQQQGQSQVRQPGQEHGPGGMHGEVSSAMNRGDLQPPAGGLTPRPGTAADIEAFRRQSLGDLAALRQMMRDDPETARDIQELIREMQQLGPDRFPGNPELLGRMQREILPMLQQIEVQLRRQLDEQVPGNVRSGAGEQVPAGYADAVAEYFRRLSRSR